MKYLSLIFLLPLASAEECSILNLGTCISQNFFNFLLNILTSPLQLILDLIYTLLVKPVNIEIFSQPLAVVIYILSMFYGILIMYSGFKFMLSGYSFHQREKAKQSLANTIILITLVQASYFIYSLAMQLTASVTASLMNLINPNLFKLTADNLLSFSLQLALATPYLLTIITTLVILTIRFIIVSIGVLIFPIAIFFYFIEPLKSYGQALMNLLFSIMSLTFFYAIFFIACSTLLNTDATLNTLIMIATFAIVNLITILITLFVLIKAAIRTPKINIIQKLLMYEIPQQLEYQEKIIFNLTFVQLMYATIFTPIIFSILKLPMQLTIKIILTIPLICLASAFMFLNLTTRIKHFYQWYTTRELSKKNLTKILKPYQIKDNLIEK